MIYIKLLKRFVINSLKKYEISNFSKKGFECKHNLNYWNCGEWIGIGPGAHSRVKEK